MNMIHDFFTGTHNFVGGAFTEGHNLFTQAHTAVADQLKGIDFYTEAKKTLSNNTTLIGRTALFGGTCVLTHSALKDGVASYRFGTKIITDLCSNHSCSAAAKNLAKASLKAATASAKIFSAVVLGYSAWNIDHVLEKLQTDFPKA